MKYFAVILLAFTVPTLSQALDRGGVHIGGSVQQKVRAGNVTNVAIGARVSSKQSLGSIHKGVRIGGGVKLNVRVGNATNVVIGAGPIRFGKPCQAIGSVGEAC